jgi:2-polyprenyl-3-methyl-5-hydroxy-6-metoxy-1,4-benzoquinol methylase
VPTSSARFLGVPSDPTHESATGRAVDLDTVISELKARIEERRVSGEYPDDLEATLDEHFDRLVGVRPRSSPALHDELQGALHDLSLVGFSRARIDPASRLPGGRLVHRTMSRAMSRQIDGVLSQVEQQSWLVTHAIALLGEIASTIGYEFDTKVLQQLDDLQVRLAEQVREVNRLEYQVAETRERLPGCAVDAWYGQDHFTAFFRGGSDDLRSRYTELAKELIGCDPVVDLGFGRGEFMELLTESGVSAHGVEPDPQLVTSARGRGLDVEQGFAVEYLRGLEPGSLGGIVMIQVIEHLSPQHVIDFVALAAEKLRPGGKVVLETVNPASLYTYAHAFWVDPDHVRPVHPGFMEFLFREAEFAKIAIEYRSPVADNERLLTLPGDDPQTKLLNENFERIGSLLFGAQDYAVIATR